MKYNIEEEIEIEIVNGTRIEQAIVESTGKQDFKYLGSWVDTTYEDMRIRKGAAWSAMNKMDVVWKSNFSRETKIRLFRATIESVLLYGCETWTLKKTLEKAIDGCYTRMIRKAFNISWRQRMTNKDLYMETYQKYQQLSERED